MREIRKRDKKSHDKVAENGHSPGLGLDLPPNADEEASTAQRMAEMSEFQVRKMSG